MSCLYVLRAVGAFHCQSRKNIHVHILKSCSRQHTNTHACIHTHGFMHTHAHRHRHKHAQTRTCICVYTFSFIYVCFSPKRCTSSSRSIARTWVWTLLSVPSPSTAETKAAYLCGEIMWVENNVKILWITCRSTSVRKHSVQSGCIVVVMEI